MKFLLNLSIIIAQVTSFIHLSPDPGMVRSVSKGSMTRCSSRTSLDDLEAGEMKKTEPMRDDSPKEEKSTLSTLFDLADRPVSPPMEMVAEMVPFVVLGELIAHASH